MNPSLDLNILPLTLQDGQEQADLPDLYAVTPPRRPARGREADSLIIYLSMVGNAPLAPEQHAQLLERLAQKFYKTSGSVTSALRTTADALNLHLLDRNLRSTSAGRQGIGLLVLGVLHGDTVYMAHCGPVHAFIVTPQQTQHLHDPQSAGRGLGLSRTTPIRFVQARLAEDDFLLLASQPAPGWTISNIRHPARLGLDGLRRQLLDHPSPNMNAALIHARPGTGKLRLLRRKPGVPDMAHPASGAPAPETPSAPATSQPAVLITPPPAATLTPSVNEQQMPASVSQMPERREGAVSVAAPPRISSSRPSQPAAGAIAPAQPVRPESQTRRPTRRAQSQPFAFALPILAAIGRALGNTLAVIGRSLGRLLKNILPDEGVLHLPPSVMVFFALAVPLVLSTIGVVVFAQRGRAQQHQAYYQQATQDAAFAATLTDPNQQRSAWNSVLENLDKAEYFGSSTEAQELRDQANAVLDNLDAIERLNFLPAIIGGLDDGVQVVRMVVNGTDLYLLNASQGSVLRARFTSRGYEIDPNFQCGPTYGPIQVGRLVDIAEMPPGSFQNASVLGMDAGGNLLYCITNEQPLAAAMAQPLSGFGEPMAFTLSPQGNLYVLDPKANMVWVYFSMDVNAPPHFFFGDYIPPLQDVLDLEIYNNDLYLLHSDGHITKCAYSGLDESPTQCEEPYPFTDARPGRLSGSVIQDSIFSQIHYISYPGHSLYMLDSHNQAIFYFSVLLNLQWQYRSQQSLPEGEATAFAISPDGLIFIAVNHQIYYAAMLP